ncbi:MAG: hypothetical protein WAM14_10480 [Candidatus Nitrosopolaris sp.]
MSNIVIDVDGTGMVLYRKTKDAVSEYLDTRFGSGITTSMTLDLLSAKVTTATRSSRLVSG